MTTGVLTLIAFLGAASALVGFGMLIASALHDCPYHPDRRQCYRNVRILPSRKPYDWARDA